MLIWQFEVLKGRTGLHRNENSSIDSALYGLLSILRIIILSVCNHWPITFSITRINNKPSTSRAALNILMSCVLGSMNFHTKAQTATISDKRNIKNTRPRNILLRYPILIWKSSKKYPSLTYKLLEKPVWIQPNESLCRDVWYVNFRFSQSLVPLCVTMG